MATSNEVGAEAYKQASAKIDGEIIQAAGESQRASERTLEQEVEEVAPSENALPEISGVLSYNLDNNAEGSQTLDEVASDFPTGQFSAAPFTERISMLGKTGQLEYPEYRTLSQQERASFEKASNSPEYMRLARRSFQEDLENTTSGTVQQVKNEVVRYAADLLSGDRTELWLGNTLATGDWSDAGSMLLQGASWLGGKLTGALGMIFTPTELADATLTPDKLKNTVNQKLQSGAITQEQADAAIAEIDDNVKVASDRYNQQVVNSLRKSGKTEEEINAILNPEDTKLQTIGKQIMNAAMRDLETKAALLPQGTYADENSIARTLTGGALSMGELLLGGLGGRAIGTRVGTQMAKSRRITPETAARFESITGKKPNVNVGLTSVSEEGAKRFSNLKAGQYGSAASLGLMTNDILGGGAYESVVKYIEETGDTDLSNYTGDLRKIALDVANATVQNWIESRWGVNKFIKNPRLATKYGEWVNGFIQEFTQGEVNDLFEYAKGNQDAKEVFANIANNVQEGLVGGLLQGALGTSVYMYNHKRTVAELRKIIMAQNPEISYSQADAFAEQKATELEENMVKDIAKDIVDFTDTKNYRGEIYNKIYNNLLQTINAQREFMKDTIDGSRFDEMTEQELATYISQVAGDQTDRVIIEALETKTPLSEVPALRGEVIDGTYYLEGSDYAKRTAQEARERREQIRKIIYDKRQAAKAEARAIRQAELDRKTANLIADGRERAKRIREQKESLRLIKESDARIAELEKAEKKELEQIAKLEKQAKLAQAKKERDVLKAQETTIKSAIRSGNVDVIRNILSDNGFRTRDLSGTAIKQLASYNWELFEGKDLGMSARRGETNVAKAAMERNVESGNDVLLRAGFTQEQIDKMDDATWNRAVLASYREENADAIAREEKKNREAQEAMEQLDLDDIGFQDDPFSIADENARLDDIYPAYDGETIEVNGVERTVYNSDGDRIAKSEPALRNFWNWFGDSKVVDEQGRPLVVYHGTNAEFDTFDKNLSNLGMFGKGFYFARSKNYAAAYGAKNLMSVYLSIQNPLIVYENKENLYKELRRLKNAQIYNDNLGYDGVIRYNENQIPTFVAFEPNQIKSTENRGTFSADTGNIYFQSAYAGARVDYDRPSLEAINSGEGNQAHGWGLYYALNPEIANRYRTTFLTGDSLYDNYSYNGGNLSYEEDMIVSSIAEKVILTGKPVSEVIKEKITKAKKDIETNKAGLESETSADGKAFRKEQIEESEKAVQFLQKINPADIVIKQGQVHEVDIPEMDYLLDEQKGYDNQSDYVKDRLNQISGKEYPNYMSAILNGKTGKEIYNALIMDIDNIYENQERVYQKGDSPAKQASLLLEKNGIKGITYDGRQDGRCFVIFNPDDVKVLRKKFDELGNVLFQSQNQSGKGGAYDARTRSITLGAKADATTLPHELAHYWVDKNFKWARSGNASRAWLNTWLQVEKWLGIDPEDKVLDSAASEKFARGFEKFLGTEKLPVYVLNAMADFQNFVLDHYDFDLDEARGLQDKFGRPIQLDESAKNWFRKANFEDYMSPEESLVVDARIEKENKDIKIAERVEKDYDKIVAAANMPANEITRPAEIAEMPSGMDVQRSGNILNDKVMRKIGGGDIKESQGQIGKTIGAKYESTNWDVQEQMVNDYLSQTSLNDAMMALRNETYPQNIDPNFLRARLVDELNKAGREDEAAVLVVEAQESLTYAAQTLQAARILNTPFQTAINQIVQQKAEKLAKAKFGNRKDALSKLDEAIDKIVDKYETAMLNAEGIAEMEAVYAAMTNEALRTIGSLNKNESTDLLYQTVEEQRQDKELRKKLQQRGSVKAYRTRAKALLKKTLGIMPTKSQEREIARLASEVSKVIANYRAKVRAGKVAALDPKPVLMAQNKLNNYLASQVGSSWLAENADALNSFMMANMLWNPATQFKNLVGNSVQLVPHWLGAIAKYKNTGTVEWAKKKEILQNAVKMQLETGYNVFSLTDFFDRKTLWAEKYYEPTTATGKFIRAPLTLLGLSDTIFKGFVFLNHADIMATSIAREEAKQNGWDKAQTDARAKELFYQSLNTDPRTITLIGAKIRSEAIVEGEEATYTQNSASARFANQFRNMLNFDKKTGVGNLLIPFTSTVANIAQDAVANWTLGTFKEAIKNPSLLLKAINPKIGAEMRKDAWKAIAPEYKNVIKNAMGALLLLTIAAFMGDDDDFVLDYNLQTDKDKDIRQNRNAPYGTSVRIGDKWVQLDVLAGAFLPVQTYLTARRHDFTADGWLQGVFGWRNLMPAVSEMESLIKDYQNGLKYNKNSDAAAVEEIFTDQGSEILTRLIPMGALVNQIGNITDDTKREKWNNWYDKIFGRIPVLRNRLPEQTSKSTGKPIPQTDTFWNLLSGGNVKDYVAPSQSDIARYEFIDAGRALRFNEASSRLKELGKDTPKYKKAVQDVRMAFDKALARLSATEKYKAMSLEDKRKAAVDLHTDIVEQVAARYGIRKKKALKKR